MGKAEGEYCAKGRGSCQEIRCSEAHECSHAEEIISNDEGKVGGEEEGSIKEARPPARLLHPLGNLGIRKRLKSMEY